MSETYQTLVLGQQVLCAWNHEESVENLDTEELFTECQRMHQVHAWQIY